MRPLSWALGYHLLMLAAFSLSFRVFLHNVPIIYCGTSVLIHGANPASSSVLVYARNKGHGLFREKKLFLVAVYFLWGFLIHPHPSIKASVVLRGI